MKISRQKTRESKWGFFNWKKHSRLYAGKNYYPPAWEFTIYLGKNWYHIQL